MNFNSSECESILNTYTFSLEKLDKAKKIFRDKYGNKIETIRFDNHLKSKNLCNLVCSKLLETLEKNSELKGSTNYSFLQKQIQNLKKIYSEEAKGPAKYEIFSSNFLEGALRISERLFQNQKIEYEEFFFFSKTNANFFFFL